METRKGDWMQTYTGRAFWPLDPRADEVNITDIAHSLSMQCRFAGHVREFYSVAEHSVRVYRAAAEFGSIEVQRMALLHDASEAYLVDLPRPVKRHMRAYCVAEAAVMTAICERFALPRSALPGLSVSEAIGVHDKWSYVKHLDNVVLATEARDLMGTPPRPWEDMPPPQPERIVPMNPQQARGEFLRAFAELFPHEEIAL